MGYILVSFDLILKIIIRYIITMKKLQIRTTVNKSKLHLNYHSTKKQSRLVINRDLLKENLNPLRYKQQKEEKIIVKEQHEHLPSIKSIRHIKSLSTNIKNNQSIKSKKCFQMSAQERRLSSYDQNRKELLIQNYAETIKTKIRQFLHELQYRNIAQNKLQKICISSCNLQIILSYIITQLNTEGKNISKLFTNLFKQQSIHQLKPQQSNLFIPLPKIQKNKQNLGIFSKIYGIYIYERRLDNKSSKDIIDEVRILNQTIVRLQSTKYELGCRIAEQQQKLINFQKTKDQLHLQIKYASKQLQRLSKSIDQNTKTLLKVQQKTKQLQNFVKVQSNKIVRQASQYHKNIQIDMFEYEDYLRHHPLGKQQFLHSIYYTEIQRLLNEQLERFDESKYKQTDADSIQRKNKNIESFLMKIKRQYSLMIDQLHHAIDEKTKYIKEFCKIVFLWYENYLTKTQFLGNLKKAFSLQVVNIEKCKKKFCHQQEGVEKCPHCGLMRIQLKKLFNSVEKAVELFGMGNSFY